MRTLLENFCLYLQGEWEQRINGTDVHKRKIKGDSNIMNGKLKQKWGMLTDEDLKCVEGKHDEWLARIQKRTGETPEAIEKFIKDSDAVCDCK